MLVSLIFRTYDHSLPETDPYSALWDDDGIKTWFFPRGSVPDDIDNGAPQPSGWSKPIASFPASTCKPSTYFYSHTAIFDTTLW